MKLFTKLLPVATVASVASIVVPLTTACASGISDFDYSPSISVHETKTYDTLKEAMGEYFANVKENPEILVQDYYWTIAQREKAEKATLIENYKNVSLSFNVSAKVSQVESTTIDTQTIYYLTCTMHQSQDMKYTSESTTTGKKVSTTYASKSSLTYECTKVAFTLSYYSTTGWTIQLYIPDNYAEEWEIITSGDTFSSTKTVSDDYDDYSETKNSGNDRYNKDNPVPVYFNFSFVSYYFQNVKIK